MAEKERKLVGSPLNFRGLVYGPINEQGVVYLFGLIASDLNIRVESIQQGYPDCTAVRYVGKGRWERINIEFEFKSSNFDHDPDKCDLLVCWEDDLPQEKREIIKGLEVYELKSMINTVEVPNNPPRNPEEVVQVGRSQSEFSLDYHFNKKNVSIDIQELYTALDSKIKGIDDSIWVKYAQTAITYYSPEKVFVYLKFRKSSLFLTVYTDQQALAGVENIKNHENWGKMHVDKQTELPAALTAIEKSFEIIKQAVKNNENTGWYALTPKNATVDITGML
jgi:hypothetical protein